ncbi:MAG: FliM/FliN family flagellar motor switch protein [Bryobacterales bacterium]|nr:FliM/FliN family flagellar motor switch protein [Bryobacterales bacterium]
MTPPQNPPLQNPLDELHHFADIALDIVVELDKKVIAMRQILELEAGSVLKLTRSAGENIDILVGGALVAFGEIVVIEDQMGVRITDFNTGE